MVGAQKLRFEPPDILWVDFQGKVSLEEITLLVDCYRKLGTSAPFFLVGDLRGVPRMDEEPQRYLSEHADPSWVLGNVFIGARLVHKAAVRGIYLAAWLTGRVETSEVSKIHFVSTPAEASELVARLRARLGGTGA
jgi:hypothetical protein